MYEYEYVYGEIGGPSFRTCRRRHRPCFPGLKAGLGGLRPTGLERQVLSSPRDRPVLQTEGEVEIRVLQDPSPQASSLGFSRGTRLQRQERHRPGMYAQTPWTVTPTRNVGA